MAPGTSFVQENFSTDGLGDGVRMIQVHHIYCALYLYYEYISSTSDHQALDLGGWGPLESEMVTGPSYNIRQMFSAIRQC